MKFVVGELRPLLAEDWPYLQSPLETAELILESRGLPRSAAFAVLEAAS